MWYADASVTKEETLKALRDEVERYCRDNKASALSQTIPLGTPRKLGYVLNISLVVDSDNDTSSSSDSNSMDEDQQFNEHYFDYQDPSKPPFRIEQCGNRFQRGRTVSKSMVQTQHTMGSEPQK